MKKIIIPSGIVLILSIVTTYYTFKWLSWYSIDPIISNTFSMESSITFIIKIFVSYFIYYSSLLILPFLMTNLIKWFKIKKNDWWKAIIVGELFFLVFSHLSTPPDITSTILSFLMYQPIAIVNSIVLRKKLNKQFENVSTDGS